MNYNDLYDDFKTRWAQEILPLIEERRASSHPVKWLLTGAALGVLGMYILDPQKGLTRRTLLRDKLVKWANNLQIYGKNQLKGLEANFNRIQHIQPGSPTINATPKSKSRDQSFN